MLNGKGPAYRLRRDPAIWTGVAALCAAVLMAPIVTASPDVADAGIIAVALAAAVAVHPPLRRLLRACAYAADRRSQPRRSDPRAAAERGAGRGGGRRAAQPRPAPGHRRAPDPDPVRAHRRRDHGTGDRRIGAASALDAGPGRRCHPGRHLLLAGRLEVLRRVPRRAGQRLAYVRGGDLPVAARWLPGVVVAVVGILQSLSLLGVPGMLENLSTTRPTRRRPSRRRAWVVDVGRAAGGCGCDDVQPGDRRRTAAPRVAAPRTAGRGVRDPRLRSSRLGQFSRCNRTCGGGDCVRPDRRPSWGP